MVETHMQMQLAPNNIRRGSCIHKLPDVDKVVQEKTTAGGKPYMLRVKGDWKKDQPKNVAFWQVLQY